jgi:hypothetical protein
MRKETADVFEMLDIPMTKYIRDLLEQMDKWNIPYTPYDPTEHF